MSVAHCRQRALLQRRTIHIADVLAEVETSFRTAYGAAAQAVFELFL